MTQDGGNVGVTAAAERQPPRTLEDYQAFVAELHARCTPREGYVSTRVELMLDAREVSGLDNLARALSLMSPYADQIRKVLSGGGRR